MNKRQQLDDWLRQTQQIVIAYSGGIDSTYLLHRAVKLLGSENVHAIVVDSVFIPPKETKRSVQQAELLQATVRCIPIDELSHSAIANNHADSWYWIKYKMFEVIVNYANEHGIQTIADGTIVDDLSEYRPGLKAREKWHIHSPLATYLFTKQDIRHFAKEEGLTQWNKPSACSVISRFEVNAKVTLQAVQQVIQSEDVLEQMGIVPARVRYHGNIARIETTAPNIEKILSQREKIDATFKQIGFEFVALDLQYYQSGNMTKKIHN